MTNHGKYIFIIGLALVLVFQAMPVYALDRVEYVWILDITVDQGNNGEITIAAIGRYGPFRRYSWFRIGDVIEAVDGVRVASIFDLLSIHREQDPFIRYRRGVDVEEKQISLERSIYGAPPFLTE